MRNPFRFRPAPGEDWADNWLSNGLAWASSRFLPRWCASEGHWTSRLTDYLFTDCPCCLLWRGLALGFVAGLVLGLSL